MIFALSDISFSHLSLGPLNIAEVDPSEASELLTGSIESQDLKGIYKFSEVEDEYNEIRFYELLAALKHVLGIAVPSEFFFSTGNDGAVSYPTPYHQFSVSREDSLLLLKYSLIETFDDLAAGRIYADAGQLELERTQYDAKLVETLFPMKVANDSLQFFHIQCIDT